MEKFDPDSQKQLWSKIIAKVWADEDYKSELQKNTNEVLKKEGVFIPEGMTVHITDTKKVSTPSDFYFVLPEPKTAASTITHSETKIAAATGGSSDGEDGSLW